MSTDSHASHDHGANDGDHHPHVLPMSTYLATWGTLLVLTVVTVAVSYVNLGTSTNLMIAMFIATIKASAVAAIFMHLRYDHKFHTVILLSAFVFLGVFITFTMFDTETRGRADAIEGVRVRDMKLPFAKAEMKNEAATVVPQDLPGTYTLAVPTVLPVAEKAPAAAEHEGHDEHHH